MENKKNLYKKALIIFIAVMVGLTFLSRAADSVTIAKVEADVPVRGTLLYKAAVEGAIGASEEDAILGIDGMRIEKCYVEEGQKVAVGAPLLAMNSQEVTETLSRITNEISAIQLSLEKLDAGSGEEAVQTAKRELERAEFDNDLMTELNGGVQLLEYKRKVEDAQAKLREVENSRNQAEKQADIDAANLSAELPEKKRVLSLLQRIAESGGVLAAEEEGTIGEIYKKQGETMNGETVMTVIPRDAAYRFKGELEAADAKHMEVGDLVSITCGGQKKPMADIQIQGLKTEDGITTVTAQLPQGQEAAHQSAATLQHERKSEEYASVVPFSALRGSPGAYFIYVVGQDNTVLGKQEIAVKILVELLNHDGKTAAITGIFEKSDLVISNSSKPIEEGDRVRLQAL